MIKTLIFSISLFISIFIIIILSLILLTQQLFITGHGHSSLSCRGLKTRSQLSIKIECSLRIILLLWVLLLIFRISPHFCHWIWVITFDFSQLCLLYRSFHLLLMCLCILILNKLDTQRFLINCSKIFFLLYFLDSLLGFFCKSFLVLEEHL